MQANVGDLLTITLMGIVEFFFIFSFIGLIL